MQEFISLFWRPRRRLHRIQCWRDAHGGKGSNSRPALHRRSTRPLRFPVEWNVEVGKDASGNPVMQTIELLELPEDLENLGAELFKLK